MTVSGKEFSNSTAWLLTANGQALSYPGAMETYCFDIDGTLCEQHHNDYSQAMPYKDRIKRVNTLFDDGHRILLFTARGSKSGIDWLEATTSQLKQWGVMYHELIVGKPHADFYIDDKAVHADDFEW